MEYGKYSLEHARAMARTRIMEPPLAVLDPRIVEVEKPRGPKKRIKGKQPTVSKRGSPGRVGEKGRALPMNFAGNSQLKKRIVGKQAALDGTGKSPVKFPTEAQMRDNAGRRAAMLARDGLDATKLQDRLGSLRP